MFYKLFEQIEATKLADKILETYKRVETDESFTTGVDGSTNTPVATLADEYGGRAQIATDDHCYVLYLLQEDGSYRHTAWIFPEAHDILKDLPDPGYPVVNEKCDPENGIKEFEYLLHHIITDDDGKEEIHHCLVYDHVGNMFEQGHLVVENGKATLDGKKVKDGTFHVIKGLESSQEVAWSDEEAKQHKITIKKMKSGMTHKDKSKEW